MYYTELPLISIFIDDHDSLGLQETLFLFNSHSFVTQCRT